MGKGVVVALAILKFTMSDMIIGIMVKCLCLSPKLFLVYVCFLDFGKCVFDSLS